MSTRSMRVKAIWSRGILRGFGAVSTLAAWTGSATATSTVKSATVALGVGATVGSATSQTYSMTITGNNLYPGASSASTVTVKNTGSISAPYTVSGNVTETGSGTLGAGLAVTAKVGATVSGSGSNITCAGGTNIVSKNANASFSASSDPRTLAAGSSETLCVQYSLPSAAANTLQGSSTTISLNFTSTVGS